MFPKNTHGVSRFIKATRYSWQGILSTLKTEAAFREEVLLLFIVIPLALWLGDNGVERALLLGSYVLILIIELLNSAVEAVVDRIGSEHHELSGKAKDIGSAAVFVSIILAIITWILILI